MSQAHLEFAPDAKIKQLFRSTVKRKYCSKFVDLGKYLTRNVLCTSMLRTIKPTCVYFVSLSFLGDV